MDSALVSHLSRTIRRAVGAGSRLCDPGLPVLFVGSYFSFILKCEANVVEPMKQAISLEITNLEAGGEPSGVAYQPGFQIDSNLISSAGPGPIHQFGDVGGVEDDRQQTVLHAIVPEDVGKRRRDEGAKAIISERPGRMFA